MKLVTFSHRGRTSIGKVEGTRVIDLAAADPALPATLRGLLAGGRGLLQAELAGRGALVRQVHVYRRVPARLDRRHFDVLSRLPRSACVLLSSAEALHNLRGQLPAPALARWLTATAVVSSERLAAVAREAGFARVRVAASALPADLLAGVQGLA